MVPVVAGSIPVVRPISRIAGLVLAGGQATRMGGGDKALLALGAHTLLDEILRRLAPQVDRCAISANGDPARFAHTGLPVLADQQGAGPLAGVLAGLTWAQAQGADALLTVPGDTPFIPTDLAACLAPAPSWACSATGTHHLVALWPAGVRGALAAYVAAGNFRVSAFGAAIAMRAVAFTAVPDPFFNINTRQDLSQAQARFGLPADGGKAPGG